MTKAKIKSIENVLALASAGEDFTEELKYLKVGEIMKYAKLNRLIWKIDEVGKSQKLDIVKSIVKHN